MSKQICKMYGDNDDDDDDGNDDDDDDDGNDDDDDDGNDDDLNKDIQIFIQENEFENVCKLLSISLTSPIWPCDWASSTVALSCHTPSLASSAAVNAFSPNSLARAASPSSR